MIVTVGGNKYHVLPYPVWENVIPDYFSRFPLTHLDSTEPLDYYRGIDICVGSNPEEEEEVV